MIFLQGCSKKFAQSTNLKSHILTHAKQKGGNNAAAANNGLNAVVSANAALTSANTMLAGKMIDCFIIEN